MLVKITGKDKHFLIVQFYLNIYLFLGKYFPFLDSIKDNVKIAALCWDQWYSN
jgi:hypothetical protein